MRRDSLTVRLPPLLPVLNKEFAPHMPRPARPASSIHKQKSVKQRSEVRGQRSGDQRRRSVFSFILHPSSLILAFALVALPLIALRSASAEVRGRRSEVSS